MNSKFRALGVIGVAVVMLAAVSTLVLRNEPAHAGGIAIQPTAPHQNPVLVYDVTGGTLAGVVHFRLSVYDTGLATISSAGFSPWEPPGDGEADFTFVTTTEAKALREELEAAGAFSAKQGGEASDLPLTTVTVFANQKPDTKCHTFNLYFPNSQAHFDTLEVINKFIDTHFPNF